LLGLGYPHAILWMGAFSLYGMSATWAASGHQLVGACSKSS
jgi:hypothetical protein